MSDSLWHHGLQNTKLLWPPLSPGVYSNSCPLSRDRQCYPIISSLAAPFSFNFRSFPASGSFPVSQLFASGCQSTGASASASVLPVNIQGWFPLGLTSWISFQSKETSSVFSCTTIQKHQFFSAHPFLWSNSHIYMTIGKKHESIEESRKSLNLILPERQVDPKSCGVCSQDSDTKGWSSSGNKSSPWAHPDD